MPKHSSRDETTHASGLPAEPRAGDGQTLPTEEALTEARDAAVCAVRSIYATQFNMLTGWRACRRDPNDRSALDDWQGRVAGMFTTLAQCLQRMGMAFTSSILDVLMQANAGAGNLPTVALGRYRSTIYHQHAWESLNDFLAFPGEAADTTNLDELADALLPAAADADAWGHVGPTLAGLSGDGRYEFWKELRRLVVENPIDEDELQTRLNAEWAHAVEWLRRETGYSTRWSKSDSPKRWAKVFGCSVWAMIRHFETGVIRNKKLSDRSYMVSLDDLPASYRESPQKSGKVSPSGERK